jgi:hypothetical protein
MHFLVSGDERMARAVARAIAALRAARRDGGAGPGYPPG